jgi:TetR/AcrR family transcriptional repressor of nem operon
LDTMPALRAWADRLVASARDSQGGRGCPIGRLAGQLAETDDEARGELERGFVRWHDGLAAGLRQMHDRGELAGDPDELATGLLAAVQGGLVLSQTARSAAPLATALRLALTAVAGWLTAPQTDAAKNRRRVAARVGG